MIPEQSVGRSALGAIAGALVGIALCAAWVRATNGMYWLPGVSLPQNVHRIFQLLIPFMCGGGVAGAWIGGLLPSMRRPLGAALIAGSAVALYFAVGGAFELGSGVLEPGYLGLSVLVSCAAALPLGLLIREVASHTAPQLFSSPSRIRSFAGVVVNLVSRLPGVGGGMRERYRAQLRAQPFPTQWRDILSARIPLYTLLPQADQCELERQIVVFLAEKRIEGCGIFINDTVRVTIAAQACLLTLHLDADYYPRLRTILVYPRTYVPKRPGLSPHWEDNTDSALLGESWQNGVIVLSWQAVRAGASDPDDGDNVVLHEFAHQLDQEDGTADGLPLFDDASAYRAFAEVLHAGFERLKQEEADERDTVLSYYGATNPAEFFAVATETFFERPRALQEEYPELYDQLRRYYRQDPSLYFGEETART